jgi:hypothetical protein
MYNKKKKNTLTILFGSMLILSCGNEEANVTEEPVADTTEQIIVEAPSPHDLILIDNQKWVIDEGMRVSIDSIEMNMAAFNGSTLEEYTTLSGDLSHHTKSIISNCTMTGQAHDELHKWLLPFIDLRKSLDGIAELGEGEMIASELNHELIIFNDFFE